MQQLSVIGVEDDVLILESESGERFRVPVASLPERRKQPAVAHRERKASPREIQSLIRGGMTAQEVASSTGEELAYIERFEAPVLAERAHMLESALSIPVATGDIDPLAGEQAFGAAIAERLDDLRATDRSWAAWKDADGGAWTLRLRFTTEGIQHEALWGYEPKKATLTPRGKEATSLSQSSDATSVLVPRLRAIDQQGRPQAPQPEPTDAPAAAETPAPPISQRAATGDAGRFDSDAFRIQRGPARSAPSPVEPGVGLEDAVASAALTETAPEERAKEPTRAENPWLRRRGGEVGSQPENVQAAAINRPAAATQPNHTAELLDALRRRRSEREAALRTAESDPVPVAATDAPEEPEPAQRPQRAQATGPVGAKKRGSRAAMPSWDEIVFGSRSDD
ncbi:septation protein SepH [Agrococcus sp. HG114]|uniref:septation protein SepH n=1 Tax=Agrococcus sp. HG114 TaxID=2969757 RepID=UPI00215A529E|nr:septation protein SepH [Agrococcus sp. HG114]MCR8669951.1 septation protein SepH [Agrococcus sp. HG114]